MVIYFWQDAIKNEMKNPQVAFKLLGGEDKSPFEYN